MIARFGSRRRSRGIVLPLSLVMLVMVTLIAVVALRGVTTEERIAANLRASSMAFELAELGLRHCEAAVKTHLLVPNVNVFPESTPRAWKDPANPNNWTKEPPPPATQYPANVSPPQCVIEEASPSPLYADPLPCKPGECPEAYLVTARGYSDLAQNFRATVQSHFGTMP